VPEAPSPQDQPLRFGDGGRFELRPAERRLLVDGSPAALGARAFDLLIALVQRRDRVVTKNELLDCVWPDVVVEEQNLHVQVSHLRKVFGKDVLATVPGRGYRFTATTLTTLTTLEPLAAAAPPPSGSSAPTACAAPPPPRLSGPRLFGRGVDSAELDALLASGSVTLVGPSGVGKTSLARAAAARWGGTQAWVDLAALNDGRQIHGAVARALGGQLGEGEEVPQLLRAAQGHASLLLVLDNAEHLIDACAVLAGELMRGLPDARLLVTSQLPLAVAGEHIKRLEPLRVNDNDDGGEAADDAVALLVERITAADQRFRVTPAARPLLEAVCTQLDGLPLALEMAAARVPQIGLQAVHDALSQRFALLKRGNRDAAARHRTLHQALEWSYQLLGAPEQALFRALGVFAGGFTLDLAVALVAGDSEAGSDPRWDVIDRLAALVDRSLVTVSVDDPPRYRLLETMRAFALEQAQRTPDAAPKAGAGMGEVSELDAARRRHAAAVFAVFQPFLRGPVGPGPWLAEMENAREACRWAREHDLAMAALLTTAIARPTTFTIWRAEVKQWVCALEAAMRSEAGVALPLEVRALWWSERARVAVISSEIAAEPAEHAMALARSLGDPVVMLRSAVVRVRATPPGEALDAACAELRALAAGLTHATTNQRLMILGALVNADLSRRDFPAVLEGRRQELALAREEGAARQIDAVESNLVLALLAVGRDDEAAQVGLALVSRIEAAPGGGDDNGNLPWALTGTIAALVLTGQLDHAQALAERMWSSATRFAVPWIAVPPLLRLAHARGRHEAAVQLVGYARQLHANHDVDVDPAEHDVMVAVQAQVAAALGEPATEALIAAGRRLDAAAAKALAVDGPS